jgi:hypothetical protein
VPRGAITKRSGKVIAGPGGGSLVPAGDSVIGQALFDDLDADITTGAGTTATLCTIAITLAAARTLQIWASYSITEAANGQGLAFVTIDAATVVSAELGAANPAAFIQKGGFVWQAQLGAGLHTILLRNTAVGATLFCRCATQRPIEHASILVNELVIP